MMEIDEVAVDKELWALVCAGDKKAADELRVGLDGLEIYLHAMPVKDSETVVTLRQLEAQNIVDTVTLSSFGRWRTQ